MATAWSKGKGNRNERSRPMVHGDQPELLCAIVTWRDRLSLRPTAESETSGFESGCLLLIQTSLLLGLSSLICFQEEHSARLGEGR